MRAKSPAPVIPAILNNWAGNFTYSTSSLLSAGSVEEVRTIVKKYDRLKVLGTCHCFNNIADSKDHLLSIGALNRPGNR